METKITHLKKKFKDHHYTKFIKGKRVIIVGPNTSLKGKGMGKYIDSFDIVVRHNTVLDFLPFNGEMKSDYGTKTSILYQSPSCIKRYAKKRSTLRKIPQNKIKYIVYQNGNKYREYFTGEYCFPEHLQWFKTRSSKMKVKLHYSHHNTKALTDLLNTISEVKIIPRTGFISVFDMIVHGAKYIETIGMSFNEGGGHSFRPDAVKNMTLVSTHLGKPSPHDSGIEERLTELLMKKYPLKFL